MALPRAPPASAAATMLNLSALSVTLALSNEAANEHRGAARMPNLKAYAVRGMVRGVGSFVCRRVAYMYR